MKIDLDKFYSRVELQEMLGIGKTTLYDRMIAKELPQPIKYLGRSWWPKSDKKIREAVRKASKK